MIAIYERELRAYFTSPVAYILIGLFISLSSIIYVAGNIYTQSSDLGGFLENLGTIIVFVIPILTMKSIAEERKNGTEILLITSPAKITDIVLGKFLASLSVFMVIVIITLIYPAIGFIFSQPALPPIIGGYIGFILLGASLISVGIFASSLTENQIVSAIVSFTIILFMMLIEPVGDSLGGFVSSISGWFSVFSKYEDFARGVFGLSPVVYYLSFIFIFLYLTVKVIEKRRLS